MQCCISNEIRRSQDLRRHLSWELCINNGWIEAAIVAKFSILYVSEGVDCAPEGIHWSFISTIYLIMFVSSKPSNELQQLKKFTTYFWSTGMQVLNVVLSFSVQSGSQQQLISHLLAVRSHVHAKMRMIYVLIL